MNMWSHSDILFSRDPSLLIVVSRIAPEADYIECEYALRDNLSSQVSEITCLWKEKKIFRFSFHSFNITSPTFRIQGLSPNCDYEFYLVLKLTNGTKSKSPIRFARTGNVIGSVVNYIHPNDTIYDFSGFYTCSPSILKLPSGRLLISHDVYKGGGGQNLTRIYYSDDQCSTFHHLTDLFPCFWGKLFLHNNEVYMLATSTEYGDLLISKSKDEGKTFCDYTVLIPGGNRFTGGPHKAPMPVLNAKNRLWTGIDYGSWTIGHHDTCILSAPVECDLLDAKNWILTKPLRYSSSWPGTVQGGKRISLLEGNAVLSRENEILNIPRYQTGGAIPNYGRVVVLKVNEIDLTAPLEFKEVTDFIGNLSKFSILYDEVSGFYITLVNRVTTPNLRQRNIVSLVCSADLKHWILKKDVISLDGDARDVAAQYIDFLIDGKNILFASRTAMNGAHSFHDANYITYHVIEDFRAILHSK